MEEQKAEKRSGKKRKIPLFLIIMFLGVSLFALGKMVYVKYVIPRPVEVTIFAPFERRIFDLNASEIEIIGLTGSVRITSYGDHLPPLYCDLEGKEEIKDMVDYLNSFRYTHTEPGPDFRNLGKGGHTYCSLAMRKQTGETFGCHIEEDRVCIGEVWYYGDSDFFQKLLELVN